MVTTVPARRRLPKPCPHVFHPYNLRNNSSRTPGPISLGFLVLNPKELPNMLRHFGILMTY